MGLLHFNKILIGIEQQSGEWDSPRILPGILHIANQRTCGGVVVVPNVGDDASIDELARVGVSLPMCQKGGRKSHFPCCKRVENNTQVNSE